jgi:carbon-monoxide dehydrogenase small subunit
MKGRVQIEIVVNGRAETRQVEGRRRLVEFLRCDLELTGTKAGCNQGDCGSCTVLMNGDPVRSCLVLAVQADGMAVTTVEGQRDDGLMKDLQAAFLERNAAQCGFCSAGMLTIAADLLRRGPVCSREAARAAINANLCRCTGYQAIIDAIGDVAAGRSQ